MFFKLLFIPKNYFYLVFLLYFSLGIFSDIHAKLLPPQTNTAVISGELKEWHKVTLSFQGPNTNENAATNPFMDYRLNVTFSHPDTTYVIPGFYAGDGNAAETSASGGSTWQVHFAPDRSGNWTYSVSFRTGNEVAISDLQNAGNSTHFDGETGSFYVSPTDKVQPDLRASGRVSYIGMRYRQHQGNGEYFLRGGTDSPENLFDYDDFDNTPDQDGLRKSYSPHLQDWTQGDPTWQTTKGKGLIGAINYLGSKGVNAISFLTMGHKGDDENVFPWVDPTDPIVYDVSKLAQWEIVLDHADKKGMFLHFKTAETENVAYLDNGALGSERKLYYRELIARFGHHLALNWNIGEEHDQSTAEQQGQAQYFHDHDPYGHLIVIHTKSNQIPAVLNPLIGTNSKLTGYSMNTNWNNVHTETQKWVEASEAAGVPWSVSTTEQNPAGKGVLPDSAYGGHSGTTVPTLHDTRHSILWGNLWLVVLEPNIILDIIILRMTLLYKILGQEINYSNIQVSHFPFSELI